MKWVDAFFLSKSKFLGPICPINWDSAAENSGISPLSPQQLISFLPPSLQTISLSSILGSPSLALATLKGLSWGYIQTLKFGQADNSFPIAKEQLPLLFAPGLWTSQVSMKLSSKTLSDIINTLFVCALSSSKHLHNSELALSSWHSWSPGAVHLNNLSS